MANELCTSLRLVGKDLSGKLLQIVEEHGSSATFMIASLMWNSSRSNTSICLVALHNSLSHYQNVMKKLGFNFTSGTGDNKSVEVLAPFTMYFDKSKEDNLKEQDNKFFDETLKSLFEDVNKALGSISGKKCLVIDDLSDLMSMGVELAAVITFLQYCRMLQESDRDLSLIVCSHISENCEDHRLLTEFISHIADQRVTVSPLSTGFSSSVSGSIEVVDNLDGVFDVLREKSTFHFKLSDRQIKVFAPGSMGVHG